jgi:hypothetical protein
MIKNKLYSFKHSVQGVFLVCLFVLGMPSAHGEE